MKIDKSRRGSALLIVIGMLSFMVVSAVSFSIYMRQSRVPSSYLRRASSSRYLLKAALAHAIDRLDGTFASYDDIASSRLGSGSDVGLAEGVYDDPYPGVGPSQSGDDQYHSRNGDFWDHRVFTPFGPVSPEKTVSTLTLEGLAYIPPALINEARVFSRQTRTATWRTLSYDTGRYAFSAIDVSDCFDINRVRAGERRFSAPDRRVNLSSLFEGVYGTQLDAKLRLWENDEIPFVSVADFNIAAKSSPYTPFCKYIGTSGEGIYGAGDYQSVSNALFITDTWFPPTNSSVAAANRYDLTVDQPFAQYRDNTSLRDMVTGTTDLGRMLAKNVGVGFACLYDYLDRDSLPLSFCIPTAEVAPMVCGIGLLHNGQFAPAVTAGADSEAVSGTYPDPDNPKRTVTWKATPYRLTKLAGAILLNGAAAFPFKRVGARDGYDTSFSGQALVRVYMGRTSMRCRVPESSPLCPTRNDWNNSNGSAVDGMVSVACNIDQLSFNDVKTQQDAVKNLTARVPLPSPNMPVYWLVEQEVSGPTGATQPYGTPYVTFGGCGGGLAPRDENGKVESWWADAVKAQPPTQGGPLPAPANPPNTEYVPHIAVWMLLKSGDGVVDVVPARLADDETWGNKSINLANQADKFGGSGVPVLEFRGTRPFTYSNDGEKSIATVLNGTAETFDNWAEFYAPDPRYNFAPEDWCPVKGTGAVTAQKWLDKVGAGGSGGVLGRDGRDKDIFMFVSDQEYLQSLGELAFLPALGSLDGSQNFFDNDYLDAMSTRLNGADFSTRVQEDGAKLSVGGLASGDFMWRTYSPVDDPIYDLRDGGSPVEVVSGSGDFRANPFSSDTRVLMAALKDTPFDYYVASTNQSLNPTASDKPSNASKYAFARGSTYAPMDDDELLDLADAMRSGFASSARTGKSWERAFDNLEWYRSGEHGDEQRTLFGVELNNTLHGVDRKYLYSFWRECFQNRQQLFLVFIRAEAMSIGGSGSSTLSATQLGARGVALVWRDPAPPGRGGASRPGRSGLTTREQWRQYYNTYAPHRTRVLFYHQFD